MKRFVGILIAITICLSPMKISYAAPDRPNGYEELARGDNISLLYNSELHTIAVEDKRNSYIWRSVVDEQVYDAKSTSAVLRTYMTSMFVVNYAATGTNNPAMQNGYTSSSECTTEASKIDNGIRLEYQFKNAGIELVVEITLEGDSLVVRIPKEEIKEEGKFGIVNIKILPFMGASHRGIDGYIFYPDGPGALMHYGAMKDRPAKTMKEFKLDVYGPEEVSSAEYEYMDKFQKHQAMLPIYGIKNYKNAMLAIASEGASGASINVAPEGVAVGLNRAYFEFTYRHSFEIMLSNITVHGRDVAKMPTGTRIDRNIIDQDYEMRCIFMEGDNASYSGMANEYRDFLLEGDALKAAIGEGDTIPLGLDFLMGVREERILFDRFIAMTTFKQVEDITDEFLEKGADNLQINLKGYSQGGYGLYPINWPIDRRIGGSRGLKSYSKMANEKGITLSLQANFMNAFGENGKFSRSNDVVRRESGPPVSDETMNWFLLNPTAAHGRLAKFLGKTKKYDIGVAFERIGKRIYHDYNKKSPYSRLETQKRWEDMLSLALEQKDFVAVEGGNAYVLKYADRLSNIPVETSEYHISDETVPFFQMIVHGKIPYTSEPGNLFYDDVEQKLKWIEYGCMPYFELTYENASALRDTKYNNLFTSSYDHWIDNAVQIYEEFNRELKDIWGETMVEHSKLADELYGVRYSNGTVIYINYGSDKAKYGKHSIDARDYLVVEGEGSLR